MVNSFEIPYLKVELVCELEAHCRLPPYKGSMLRGALGHQLLRSLCVTRQNDACAGCMLAPTCLYPRLFAPLSPKMAAPFCLETPMDGRTDYQPGDELTFSLALFNQATEFLPYYIHAIMRAGERGVGPKNEGKFALTAVNSGKNLYDAASGKLEAARVVKLPKPRLLPPSGAGEVEIRLLSPLRFKKENSLGATLPFSTFTRLVLRRIKALRAQAGSAFALDPREFAQIANASIEVSLDGLHWHDWRRYSSRQREAMNFGGLVGKIRYRGEVERFRQYLDFAALAHLGKQTSFGLGHIAWSLI